jgi:hypothetical protein
MFLVKCHGDRVARKIKLVVHKSLEDLEKHLLTPAHKRALVVFWGIVVWIILIILMVALLTGCSTKVSCNYERKSFLGFSWINPIPQKCQDRPNRATDIVGW